MHGALDVSGSKFGAGAHVENDGTPLAAEQSAQLTTAHIVGHFSHLRRASTIFINDRPCSSFLVKAVSSASSRLSAPQFKPRKKKFNNPCPVAASSKTSPTSVACAAF